MASSQNLVGTTGFEPVQVKDQQFYRLLHALQLGRVPKILFYLSLTDSNTVSYVLRLVRISLRMTIRTD